MKKLLLLLLSPVFVLAAMTEEPVVIYSVRVKADVCTIIDGEERRRDLSVITALRPEDVANFAAFRNRIDQIDCGGNRTFGEFLVENGFGSQWDIFVGPHKLDTDSRLENVLEDISPIFTDTGRTLKELACEVKPTPK